MKEISLAESKKLFDKFWGVKRVEKKEPKGLETVKEEVETKFMGFDFAVQPITADLLRNHPHKGLILAKYHNWLEEVRKEDKREQRKIENRIYKFKREKRKREDEKNKKL